MRPPFKLKFVKFSHHHKMQERKKANQIGKVIQ